MAKGDPVSPVLPANGHEELLLELKSQIRKAQIRAALEVTRELNQLYWQLGKTIVDRQETQGWGTKVVERLGSDLRAEFPEMKGLSARNLNYMRAFAAAYTDFPIVQQLIAQVPWGHNLSIIHKVKDHQQRLWYAQQTLEHGWSRSVLVHQMETDLYGRQGKAITNFQATLPPAQSDLAQQVLKDPYNFDFLTLDADAREKELEQGLLSHIQHFLLELGAGFAFVGRQWHLEVDDEDYYLDLLFYHLKLRCFVVIDLKTRPFRPEYGGKMNFHLSAVDDLLRHPDDQPTIGLMLCKEHRRRLTVEYALRDLNKPIGVAQWRNQLVSSLPRELEGSLPTIEEIEAELADELEDEAQRDGDGEGD